MLQLRAALPFGFAYQNQRFLPLVFVALFRGAGLPEVRTAGLGADFGTGFLSGLLPVGFAAGLAAGLPLGAALGGGAV